MSAKQSFYRKLLSKEKEAPLTYTAVTQSLILIDRYFILEHTFDEILDKLYLFRNRYLHGTTYKVKVVVLCPKRMNEFGEQQDSKSCRVMK